MAQAPAVVIIARHGPRLDAADQSWHLSTPTPYDPPLTYGGWNQCRALGVRIASLLDAREQSFNSATSEPAPPNGTKSHDFARLDGAYSSKSSEGESSPNKRRKRKHKVVIHSSPFLRCLQTSVAIAAGMAQFQPTIETGSRSSSSNSSKSRTPSQMHSASPHLRGQDGLGSLHLAPITEPRHSPHDLAHELARRALNEHKRYRKSKMRVDAFLGEWLNPQYFDQITPPPPSAMMVATAKAELIQNESIDVYTPTVSSKGSVSSLWGGGANGVRTPSRESTLDDWSHVQDALPAPTARRGRDRGSSVSSVESHDSGSGRKSPFRPGHVLQPFTSTFPKQETTTYIPPTPSYAVSSSDHIPRGYMAHARNGCVGVDYQWDSSRPPQNWGDGGEYGEEWSAMHKRLRKGLNHLVHWYSQHGADDRGEDALGFDQADHHGHEESDEQEDLVVIMVTHGAGSNALIGALTGQPVLLDVGMASLTMAVRREDAPPLPTPPATEASSTGTTPASTPRHSPQPPFANEQANGYGHRRRSSMDLGLSAIYEMKLVSSSEHLRPGADPAKHPSVSMAQRPTPNRDALMNMRQRFASGDNAHSAAGAPIRPSWNLGEREPMRSGTNASLGTIRRPSAANTSAPAPIPAHVGGTGIRNNSMPPDAVPLPTPPFSPGLTPGLWTPPAGRTPVMPPQQHPMSSMAKEERNTFFSSLDHHSGRSSPGHNLVLDFSNSPPESRPSTSGGPTAPAVPSSLAVALGGGFNGAADTQPKIEAPDSEPDRLVDSMDLSLTKSQQEEEKEGLAELPKSGDALPQALSRGLSQKGLWGNRPRGDTVRRALGEPKRRWTVNENDG